MTQKKPADVFVENMRSKPEFGERYKDVDVDLLKTFYLTYAGIDTKLVHMQQERRNAVVKDGEFLGSARREILGPAQILASIVADIAAVTGNNMNQEQKIRCSYSTNISK